MYQCITGRTGCHLCQILSSVPNESQGICLRKAETMGLVLLCELKLVSLLSVSDSESGPVETPICALEQYPASQGDPYIQHNFSNDIHCQVVRQLLHGKDIFAFRLLPQNVTKHCCFFDYLWHKRHEISRTKAGVEYVPPCLPQCAFHRDEVKVAGYRAHEITHGGKLWKRV